MPGKFPGLSVSLTQGESYGFFCSFWSVPKEFLEV
jgi:hypothetical protein